LAPKHLSRGRRRKKGGDTYARKRWGWEEAGELGGTTSAKRGLNKKRKNPKGGEKAKKNPTKIRNTRKVVTLICDCKGAGAGRFLGEKLTKKLSRPKTSLSNFERRAYE